MLVLTNWLFEWLKTSKSEQEIAQILPDLGVEVESCSKGKMNLEITPNRGDLLSVYGLAREISAKTGDKLLKLPKFQAKIASPGRILQIAQDAKTLIPRLSALVIEGVSPSGSTELVRRRLKKYEINPTNHIVDATNYIMLETGQPLHAFDLEKIRSGLKFRKSLAGEKIKTLDGVLYSLPAGVLVGESNGELVDLAGIQGGENSRVSQKTRKILLIAGVFSARAIRFASQKTRHSSEASYRYERGVSSGWSLTALGMCAKLIKGKIVRAIDIDNRQKPPSIKLNTKEINSVLGTKLAQSEITDYLKRLQFRVRGKSVEVPEFRQADVKSTADLAEEVGRLRGFNNIKPVALALVKNPPTSNGYNKIQNLKRKLVELGLQEVLTYSFISPAQAKALNFNFQKLFRISNPLSENHKFLRPCLKIGLVKVMAQNPWDRDTSIFEIGRVFESEKETQEIGFAFHAKRQIPKLISGLKFQEIGIQNPLARLYKLRNPLLYCELALEDFIKKTNIKLVSRKKKIVFKKVKYKKIAKFAPATRDIAIIAPKRQAKKIKPFLSQIDEKILLVELFDVFEDPRVVGKGKISLAFHIVFDHPCFKLTNKDVSKIMERVENKLKSDLGVKIR